METEFRVLKIPEELCQKVERNLLGEQFQTVDQFVQFILLELVQDKAIELDAEEQKIIEQRLHDLGYI